MTNLFRPLFAPSAVFLLIVSSLFAQTGNPSNSTPERIVSPVSSGLPGRTVWAFATTGTGTNITTFAATDKGLYRTSGTTWSETPLRNQAVYAVKSRRIGNTTTLLAGTDKGVMRSVDNGAMWSSPEVTTGSASMVQVSTSNILSLRKVFDIEIAGNFWFAATEKGVFRSNNDGRSWTLINIDRTVDNNEVRGITVEGNTIIVNLWREGLWRSTNNGNSWSRLTIAGETALCRAVHVQQGTNATVWLAGSVAGNIWRSVNNGTSWTRVYQTVSATRAIASSGLMQSGIDAMTEYDVTIHARKQKMIFAATATGMAFSGDDGLQWQFVRTVSQKAISLTAWNNVLYVGTENEQSNTASTVEKGASSLQNTTGNAQQYTVASSTNQGIIFAATIDAVVPNSFVEGRPATMEIQGRGFNILKSVIVWKKGIDSWGNPTLTQFYDSILCIKQVNIFGQPIAPTLTNCEGTTYPSGRINFPLPNQVINTPGEYEVQIGGWVFPSNNVPFAVKPALRLVLINAPESNDSLFQALAPVTLRILGNVNNATRLLVNGVEPSNIAYNHRSTIGFHATFISPAFGTYSITLTDGEQTSNAVSWNVIPAQPTLNSVTTSPNPLITGQAGTLTLIGENFAPNAQIRISAPEGSPILYNPTSRTGTTGLTLPFTPPTTPGIYTVDVVNPGAAQASSTRTLSVGYPVPALTSLAPNRVVRGVQATVTVNGTGIVPNVSTFGILGVVNPAPLPASQQVSFTPSATGQFSAILTNDNAGGGGGSVTLPNALTVVAPNPAPVISSFDNTRLLVNGTTRTLTLTGTGFLTGSNSDDNARTAVTIDGTAITPQNISPTQIVLSVPTAVANAGVRTISLTNPAVFSMAQGGGGSATTQYTVALPTPSLTEISPNALDFNIGTAPQTLTITGTGFTGASRVFAGAGQGTELTVTSRTATSLVVSIPAGTFPSPQTVQIRVENPVTAGISPADGGASASLPLTINNIQPTVSNVEPAQILAGAGATLTLTGTNLIANTSTVFASFGNTTPLQVQTTVSSPTSLTASIPASMAADIGSLTLVVRNTFGTDTRESTPRTVRIVHPVPTLTAISPATVPAFENSTTLTLTGTNFAAGNAATMGAPLIPPVPTRLRVTFERNNVITPLTLLANPTATQIRVTVPASLLTELGSATIRVQNTDAAATETMPTGGPSATNTLAIVPPRPTLTSVSPNTATAGTGVQAVAVTGAKFIQQGLRIVICNAQTGLVRDLNAVTFVNNTSLTGTIPADVIQMAGAYTLEVVNAADAQGLGGGVSVNTLPFMIVNPAPTITALSPNPATVYEAFTLDVQGTGFVQGATSVVVDGQMFAANAVSVLSPTRLTVGVAAINVAKLANISITNPRINNQGGGTATSSLPIVPPVPTVSQAQGSTIGAQQAGGTLTRNLAGTLTVNGSGFVAGAVITFNGQDLTTNFGSQSSLTTTVPASMLNIVGNFPVTVRNPQFQSLGGGTSTPAVNVTVQNPTAVLTSINPSSVTRGVDATLTLTGSNFYDGALVVLNNATLTPSNISANSITLTIPAANLPSAGVYSLQVRNADPTPAASAARTLTVNNPAPVLTALSLTEADAFSNDLTLTVSGTGFEQGIQAWWTPQGSSRQALPTPTNVSGNSMTLTIPAGLLLRAGAFGISLDNAAPSLGASNSLGFTVLDRVPVLTGVMPNPIEALSAATPITITGDYFAPNAEVLWNGQILTRTAVSRTSLTAPVPQSRLTLATIAQITVRNPAFNGQGGMPQGGGTSLPQELTVVNPLPALTNVSPDYVNAGTSRATITLDGTKFMPSSTVEIGNGMNWVSVTAVYVSPTRLSFTLSSNALVEPALLMLRVSSPKITNQAGMTLGGGISSELPFIIRPADPMLSRITPTVATLTVTSPSVEITLAGTGFTPASVVRIAGQPTTGTLYISPTQLRFTLQRPAGIYGLSVVNEPVLLNGTPQGGGVSGTLNFSVLNPQPQLTALLPSLTTASGKAWTLALIGTNFTPSSQVRYNGVLQSLANTRFLPSAQDTLFVKLPAVPVADTLYPVAVVNPPVNGQGGGASETLLLTVGLPKPIITSLSPTTTTATLGDVARRWTLTVNGTFFDNAATVFVGEQPVITEFVSTTRLRAVLPDSLQTKQALRSVQVRNTPLLVSNIVTHAVQNPTPVLTAIEPQSITAGRDTVITLTGDRFAPDATVRLTFGTTSTILTPSRRDSVIRLTIPLPSSLIPSRGSYSLRVNNPALALDTVSVGGGLSAPQTLTVNADKPHSVEFIGLDTLLNAGDRLWFFTLRFRDKTGNLVDNEPVTLTYTNLDSTVITGYFPVTRTSLGNYRADTLRFPVAGRYALQLDTTSSGTLQRLGANRFTVLTRPAVRVIVSGFTETLQAGGQQRFQAQYFDNQGNPTDNNVRPVVVTAAGGFSYTVGYTRISTGVYAMDAGTFPRATLYTLSFIGIDTLNILTNDIPSLRRFTVLPATAASVSFVNVNPLLTAGNLQNRFTATFRDSFSNLSDALTTDQLSVAYSNSTAATVGNPQGDSLVVGAIALNRLSIGVYQASVQERFPIAGSYAFSVQGINVTSGTTAFRVQPAGDARVSFSNLRDTITAGDSLSAVRLTYFDTNGNLTDTNLGEVFLNKRTAPGFVARMTKTRLSTGVYALQSTQATITGNYDFTVQGIAAQNISGNNRTVVLAAAVSAVDFMITTTAMTRTGAVATINTTYRDRFGNLVDFPGDLTLTNAEFASVATVSMVRSSIGVYRGSVRLYAPGAYSVQLAGNTANITIGGTQSFALEPGPAVTADFQNVLPSLTAGNQQSAFLVTLRDRRGSPTDIWNGFMTMKAPLTTTTRGDSALISYLWDSGYYGVIVAQPTTVPRTGNYLITLDDGITRYNGSRTFTVLPDSAAAVFLTTTPASATLTAGGLLAVRLRTTDRLGNRTPLPPSAVLLLQQNGLPVMRSVLASAGIVGEYTTTFRPATAGTLTFALETPALLTGTTAVTVLPTTDYRVEMSGLATSITAGERQRAFTVSFRDRFGNLTDSTVGAVIIRSGTDRDTIPMTRLAKGEYRAEQTPFTKAGAYLVTISGISAANISGDSAFVVLPDVAAKAVFAGVPAALNFGANLPAFTVRYRDRFDNPVDFEGEVTFSNINSVLVRSGLMPINLGEISTTRTAFSVSTATASAPINVAGEYNLLVDGITTFSGTKSFNVRSLPAASAQFVNVQERVAEGKTIPPFSVIYRDKIGNITDYNGNVTYKNIANTAINGTIPMFREAVGVSTATTNTPFSVAGKYQLSVSGLTIASGATTVIVTSTSGVTQARFWETPSTTIAGTPIDSFYVAFLNANSEYKNFDSAIVRYTHSSGSPGGIFTLTKIDSGIYKTNKIELTKSGIYRLTVDNVSVTSGTTTFVINPDTTIVKTVVDSLRTEAISGEIIPPFTVTHFDKFDNTVFSFPQSLVYFVGNYRGDSAQIAPSAVSPQGGLIVASQVFSSTGSFQIQAESYRLWSGNRRIQIYPPRPIIISVSPSRLTLGSTAIVTLLGRNFGNSPTVLFNGMPVNVQILDTDRLQITIHRSLITDSTGRDSILVINDSGPFGRSSPKGMATLQNGGITLRSVLAENARIDGATLEVKVVATGLQNTVYAIGIRNQTGTIRYYDATIEKDTLFAFLTGIGSRYGPADQFNTVRDFRDLGAGTHSVSIETLQNNRYATQVIASNAFFIANPKPEITRLVDMGDEAISTSQPFDIQDTEYIKNGWLTIKIRGKGLVKDSIGSVIQSTIKVVKISNPDSLCTVEVIRKDSLYYGDKSNLTIRVKIGDNIISQGRNREEYKLIVNNLAMENKTAVTAGSSFPTQGGGISEMPFSIIDSGPEIISFNPPILRAAFDTTRTIIIRVKRFQQNSQLWFKNPLGDSNRVPYILVNDSTLRVQITLSQIGDYLVRIISPDNTSSRYARLRSGNPYPVITSITPITATIGQDAQFRLEGRGFTADTKIRLNNGIEWMRIDSRLLSNQSRQTLITTIREPLVTYGQHRLTVYNDTTFGVGGFDTTSIVIQSVIPHIDSLRPKVTITRRTTTVSVFGRNLSTYSKILVSGFSQDSLSGTFLPATSTRPASMTVTIPGNSIRTGENNIYIVNPGNLVSPTGAILTGRSSSTLPQIIRLEPNILKPTNRDTTIRIVGRNFDSTATVFCFYLTNSPIPIQVKSKIADSVLVVNVPKELIDKTNQVPFIVRLGSDIISDESILMVNSLLPQITSMKTKYSVIHQSNEYGNLYDGHVETIFRNTIYAGTYVQKLKTSIVTTFGWFILPIIPRFPLITTSEYQSNFLIEGSDLQNVNEILIDDKPYKVYYTLGDDRYTYSGNGRDWYYINPTRQYSKTGWMSIAYSIRQFETRFTSLEFARIYPYFYTPEKVLFSGFDPDTFINYERSFGFLFDTLSIGKHTIQVGDKNVIRSNIFTFDVKPREATTIDRLELETSQSDLKSTVFSTLSFTIPTDTVKYIYIIAPKNNAAFVKQSIVTLNNRAIPFEYINHGVLRARITPEFINGNNSIMVTNPGGYVTPESVQNFTAKINFAEGQTDTRVTSIEPESLPAQNRDTIITIRGSGFTRYTNVILRHTVQTSFIDSLGNEQPDWGIEDTELVVSNATPTALTVFLPARFRNTVTIDTLIVGHLRWGRTVDTVFLPIRPAISINSIQPNILEADIAGEPIRRDTLTIFGRYFDSTTTVMNGQEALTILQRSDSVLRVIASPSMYSAARTLQLTVSASSGQAQVNLGVQYPRPIIDSIRPDTIEVPSGATLIALKDDASLNSGNDRRMDFPIVPGVPLEVMLFPNTPNPFDATTNIEYALPHEATLSIEIYDQLGRKVADLVEQKFHPAGAYSVLWTPPNNYGSGVYTAVLQSMDAKGKLTRKTLRMTRIR